MSRHCWMAGIVMGAMAGWMAPYASAQGSLTPPGPPGVTMRSLQQVEPRIPIASVPFTITNAGSYYLTGNLTSTGTGVEIMASDVTLDLMGFSLTGGNTNLGINLMGAGAPLRNIRVRNGNIRHFYVGIAAMALTHCRMEGIASSSNTWGGVVFNAPYNSAIEMRDCEVNDNPWGVVMAGDCREIVFTRCTIRANGNDGIQMVGSDHTMVDCAISGNASNGVTIISADGTVLQNCSVTFNGQHGVYLWKTQGSVVRECNVRRNGGHGIHLLSDVTGRCTANIITGCSVVENSQRGIYLGGNGGLDDGNTVSDCVVSGNAGIGISLYLSGGNRIEGNHCARQTGPLTFGIQTAGTSRNLIARNSCVSHTNNYELSATDTYGPIVTDIGELGTSGRAAQPWANFSR